MERVPHKDFEQILGGCLMVYGKGLVKIKSTREGRFTILHLKTGKTITVPHDELDFNELSPPKNRIGFVNSKYGCAFISRVPRRIFHAGYHGNNIEIITLPPEAFPNGGRNDSGAYLVELDRPEIVSSYYNRFPDLAEAFKTAKEIKRPVAFDRQFAVTSAGQVFYKAKAVGTVVKNAVVLNKGHEYLNILLDFAYEKTSSAFRPTPV